MTPVEEWGAAGLDNVPIVFLYNGYLIYVVKHDSKLWGKIQNTCQEGWLTSYPYDYSGDAVIVQTTSACEEEAQEDFIDDIKQELENHVLPSSLEELIEVTNLDITQAACFIEI